MKDFDINDFEPVDSEFDDRTGEELYEEFLGANEKAKDEFIYYYGGYFKILPILTGTAANLLMWLAFNCDVNTGRVIVQSFAQRQAMQDLCINTSTYYKALNQLKNVGAVKGKDAKYYVNPSYVWKGTADKRAKFLKIYPKL